jgi:hypothetical protein
MIEMRWVMANESAPLPETRSPNFNEVMALRLLARMREMWPEEAAAKERPTLTLIQGSKGRVS